VLPDRPESNDAQSGQILQFRRRWRAGLRRRPAIMPDRAAEPADHLAEFEHADRNIDYGRRMLMNVIAVVIVVLLVSVGVWIADTITDMQKVQNCTLQGRQNCAPIAVPNNPGER